MIYHIKQLTIRDQTLLHIPIISHATIIMMLMTAVSIRIQTIKKYSCFVRIYKTTKA